jgi:hypothetical protein
MSHAFLRRPRTLAGALAVVGASSLALASGASAATFNVTNTEQFVKAVSEANLNSSEKNTIVVAGGTDYKPEKTMELTNKNGLTIEGPTSAPGARLLGTAVLPFPSNFFVIGEGVPTTFKNVLISGGGGTGTPAVVVSKSGTLNVEGSNLSGDKGSQITVKEAATLNVRNSTISDGLDFGVINQSGTANFFNSTVAFNKSGGIETIGTGLNLTNTIVAENTGSGDCTKAATTSDHSLDSNGSCGVGALSKVNPLLQKELLNDGGSTPLHSLKPGSPAIDAGDTATCLTTDQRGQPRPDVTGTACDIGADEFNETPPTITVPANMTVGNASAAGAKVNFTVQAGSTDDVVRSIECSKESGTVFPIGTTSVTCTATDGHETKASASFTVTVKAPRWFRNGILLTTTRAPVLTVGPITLENSMLRKLTCQNAVASNVWNESERGLESVVAYTTFECKSELPCKVINTKGEEVEGIYATAESPPEPAGTEAHATGISSLPWSGELIEREATVHQLLTHQVKIWIVLPPGSVGKGEGCKGTEIPFEAKEGEAEKAEGDEPAPVTFNGSKNGLKPSHSEFTGEVGLTEKSFPRTGRLISPVAGPAYTTAARLNIGGLGGGWELLTNQ